MWKTRGDARKSSEVAWKSSGVVGKVEEYQGKELSCGKSRRLARERSGVVGKVEE